MRGLHWQAAPHGEIKLVRCVRAAAHDVIVDIDPQSRSYGRWFGITLSPESPSMLYVPKSCAHGFQTLADDTELNYLVSAPYVADAGRGVRFDDTSLGIEWPLPVTIISSQDGAWPLLDRLPAEVAADA